MSVKYKFENIGPVKEADLSLGDLTVIAGGNNSGKTYLAYALYGFWQFIENNFSYGYKKSGGLNPHLYMPIVQALDSGTKRIKLKGKKGSYTLSMSRKDFLQLINRCLSMLSNSFSRVGMASFFSAKEHRFKGSSMICEFDISEYDNEIIERQLSMIGEYSYDASNDAIEVVLNQHWSNHVNTASRREHDSYYLICIRLLIASFLEGYFLNKPFILSSERFGISLFFKELDFTKNRLVEELQDLQNKNKKSNKGYPEFLDRHSSRYAKPIKDNIDFTRELEEVQKDKSALIDNKLFDNIKEMMEAYYRYSDYEINFISKKQKGFKIPLHLASSSARGLSDLYFYLRHVAQKGQFLIIDEPESHLSPDNQIEMARLLVRCVNAGIKVLITTHSDYMIKEFNNLIMLSSDFEGKEDFLRKHKRHYAESDCLKKEQIKGYLCQKGKLVPCDVNEYGVQMENFDNAIEKMNEISNTLGLMLGDKR